MKGLLASLGMFGVIMASLVLAIETTSYVLLSQVEVPSIEGATSLTSIGFAIWYGWYVTTKAIPKIVDQHTAQIDKVEIAHGKQLDAMAATFREELRAVRDKFSCERREA